MKKDDIIKNGQKSKNMSLKILLSITKNGGGLILKTTNDR